MDHDTLSYATPVKPRFRRDVVILWAVVVVLLAVLAFAGLRWMYLWVGA